MTCQLSIKQEVARSVPDLSPLYRVGSGTRLGYFEPFLVACHVISAVSYIIV